VLGLGQGVPEQQLFDGCGLLCGLMVVVGNHNSWR